VRGWWLVVGGWWLVVGGWWLVVGGWWLWDAIFVCKFNSFVFPIFFSLDIV
jgi:hypothetical protein